MRVLGTALTAEWGAQAVEALENTPQSTLSVWHTIKMHQALVKTGVVDIDAAFKTKAKELFPLSTYFASL